MRVIITHLLNAKRCIKFARTLHDKYPVAFPCGVGYLLFLWTHQRYVPTLRRLLHLWTHQRYVPTLCGRFTCGRTNGTSLL